jgi:hypothetical protein
MQPSFYLPKIRRVEKALHERIDGCEKNEFWKASVMARDNHRCRRCGSPNRLMVLRIDMYEDILERNKLKTYEDVLNCPEVWSTNNGLTICSKCFAKMIKNYNIFDELVLKKQVLDNQIIDNLVNIEYSDDPKLDDNLILA